MRNLVSLRALSLVMGLLAVVGWGAFAFAIKSSSETERRLNEQVAELTVREGQLIAERDQARAEAAEFRASRDQRVAERVDVQAQLAVAREEIARLQKQVEQLHAKATSPARRAHYVQRGRETKAGPKVAIPDYETLMLPVLKAAAGGEVAIRECISRIGNEIGLSEAERNQLLPSGKGTTLASRVGWARTYLAQSGSVATGVSS